MVEHVVGVVGEKTMKWWWVWTVLFLILITGLVWRQWPSQSPEVVMCDVGQGDAILVVDGFSQMLIDAGPQTGGVATCLGSVMPFWDGFIEAVVITHADSDHMGGLDSLLKRYRVEKVVTTEAAYGRVTEVVRGRTRVVASWQNQQWQFGSIRGEVKWPPFVPISTGTSVGASRKNNENDNHSSLVVRLEWEDESWWLAGDADETVEEKLLAMGEVEQSTILKVGHHGSATSSSAPFLAILRPLQAWISVGKENRYGHPSREVLERLEILGTTVRRTDEEGLIQ